MESFETWTDDELLAAFAARQSEEAFVALVGRHVRLVYSAAFGRLHDAHLAEDVVQAVFVLLARKAGRLRHGTILSGWLYRSAQLMAGDVLKTEGRRRKREELAARGAEPEPEREENAGPRLDELLMRLGEKDRAAILLRYFEEKSIREVGEALGLGEEAARKRIDRAVEKLRSFANKRHGAVDLEAFLGGQMQAAPPAGLALRVATAGLADSTALAGSLLESIQAAVGTMLLTTAKRILPAGALAASLCLLLIELGRQLAPPVSARAVVERHLEAAHADILRKETPPDRAGTACMSCHRGERRDEPTVRAVLLAGDWRDPAKKAEGSFEIRIAGTERVLEEIAVFGADREVRGRNGARAWSESLGGARLLNPAEAEQFRHETAILLWPGSKPAVANAELESFGGRSCYRVADETLQFFDRSTGLLVGVVWPGGTNLLNEYRELDGLRTPTRIVRRRGRSEEFFHVREARITDTPIRIFEPPPEAASSSR